MFPQLFFCASASFAEWISNFIRQLTASYFISPSQQCCRHSDLDLTSGCFNGTGFIFHRRLSYNLYEYFSSLRIACVFLPKWWRFLLLELRINRRFPSFIYVHRRSFNQKREEVSLSNLEIFRTSMRCDVLLRVTNVPFFTFTPLAAPISE